MREWIRKLLNRGPAGDFLTPGQGLLAGVVAHVATRGRFRVVVLRAREPDHHCLECGQPCHWLSLDFRGHGEIWRPLLVVHERNLRALEEAVADVAAFLKAPAEDGAEKE